MSPEGGARAEALTPRARRRIRFLITGVALLYAVGGSLGAYRLCAYGDEIRTVREQRVAAALAAGAEQSHDGEPAASVVRVGITMRRLSEFSLTRDSWTADFELRLHWSGGADPGKSFDVVNGEVLSSEPYGSQVDGDERCDRYRVVARMAKPLDIRRFPFGEEAITVVIEDAVHDARTVRYVTENDTGEVERGALPRNTVLERTLLVALRRDSTESSDGADSYGPRPRCVFAMVVVPHGLSTHVRMFLAHFAAVAVALTALYVKPMHVDPRFGLGIGAFFAAVTTTASVTQSLPPCDWMTLADMVNTVGLATIFLSLMASVVSLHLMDARGLPAVSRRLDHAIFAVLLIGYVAVNVALPLAASS